MSEPLLLKDTVFDVDRCPQCGVASPLLTKVGKADIHYKDEYSNSWWHFVARCSRCQRHVLFYGWTLSGDTPRDGSEPRAVRIREVYPSLETAAKELPERAHRFLQQALESKHAPDGALMLAASSIDAMLKDKGYKDGSLFSRIEKAHDNGLLTAEMRDWAHEIRISANEPRHADDNYEGANEKDAEQVIQFAKALAEYLYVLPARVQKWKAQTALAA